MPGNERRRQPGWRGGKFQAQFAQSLGRESIHDARRRRPSDARELEVVARLCRVAVDSGTGRVLNGDGTSATPSRSKRKWGGGTHGITDVDLRWTHRRLARGPGYERWRIRGGHRHRAGHAV